MNILNRTALGRMPGRRHLSWTEDFGADMICHKQDILTYSAGFHTFDHMKQLKLFKPGEHAYGGTLMMKRKGRGPRPLATKSSMHLVLSSSKAIGPWKFQRNRSKVRPILRKFAAKYGVQILSQGDPGNHIHLHIQLSNRHAYRPFIRAVTAAIAMAVTGASRWKKLGFKFWDRRPFTRVVLGRRGFLTVRDYVKINDLESHGYNREEAREAINNFRFRPANTG